MDKASQLEAASHTNDLILVMFYTDWSPHYEWLVPAIQEYEKEVKEVIKINIEGDKKLADSFNVDTAPTFILMRMGHPLWRQTGELTPEALKEVLVAFK